MKKQRSKTYRKTVFAGKEVPFIGLDQGKGMLYQGLSANKCFNGFYEDVFALREGQDKETTYNGSVNSAGLEHSAFYLQEGSNFWIEGV